jgi:hypothetical protein
LEARIDKPHGGPGVFLNPLYAKIDGTPYLISYDWTAGQSVGIPNHFTNAGTSEIDLASYMFVDLNEARKYSRVHFFAWFDQEPRLVRTRAVDGQRELAEKLPPFSNLEVAQFPVPESLSQIAANYNLHSPPKGFKPPF